MTIPSLPIPHSIRTTLQMTDDSLWHEALRQATSQLPSEDVRWLSEGRNQEPFTSAKLLAELQPVVSVQSRDLLERFFLKIDSVLTHIASFSSALSVLAQANPLPAAVVWGLSRLLIEVACRTRRQLERILDYLGQLGPQLDLFWRWRKIFPDKDFVELRDSILTVYIEVIKFCVFAVKHLRQSYFRKLLQTTFSPSPAVDFQHRLTRISNLTARVQQELSMAQASSTSQDLSEIKSLIHQVPSHIFHKSLPKIRLIPHSRNYRFFGRDDILIDMDKSLSRSTIETRSGVQAQSGALAQRRFTLHGFGGSGKTQIAVEYSYRYMDNFQAVIWIHADNPDKMQQGFVEVAELLGMGTTKINAASAKAYVLQQLAASDEDWLLVFDNADDTGILANCFPSSNQGAILITTRDSMSLQNLSPNNLHVPEFTVDEGAQFLQKLLADTTSLITFSDRQEHLYRISKLFSGYPLALGLAAGLIRSGGATISNFETLFNDQRSSAAIAAMPIDEYHDTLATVWTLSLNSLNTQSNKVLDIMVYLDPDSIPYEMFKDGYKDRFDGTSHQELEFLSNPIQFWEALQGLQRHSLIRINSESATMSIHRFLQNGASARIRAIPSRRRIAFEDALFLLTNAQPKFSNHATHWDPGLWDSADKYLTHAKKLEAMFFEDPVVFNGYETRLAQAMYHCATYEFEKDLYSVAAKSFERTRQIVSMAETPDIVLLCDCYRVEGRLYNEANLPLKAKESNIAARKLAEQCVAQDLMKADDNRIARILTGLGNSVSQLGDLDGALALQQDALRLCRTVPRETSDVSIIVQLNLGFLYWRRKEFDRAESLLRQTVEQDPQAAYAWYPLGNTYISQGKVDEGLAAHLKSVRIYKSWFGENHSQTAHGFYKVGEILLELKNEPEQAYEYLSRSYKAYKGQGEFSDLRANIARCSRMLGRALQRLVNPPESAQPYLEKAWELKAQTQGVRGFDGDQDGDYVNILFYWVH